MDNSLGDQGSVIKNMPAKMDTHAGDSAKGPPAKGNVKPPSFSKDVGDSFGGGIHQAPGINYGAQRKRTSGFESNKAPTANAHVNVKGYPQVNKNFGPNARKGRYPKEDGK